MQDLEKNKEQVQEKLEAKADADAYKKELAKKFEKEENTMKKQLEDEAKKAAMPEIDRIRLELDELKQKYQEKENECAIAKQKEETVCLLENANLGKEVMDVVFVPLNTEATKEKIALLKSYIEKIKENNLGSTTIPLTSNKASYDAFIEGFDTNTL